MQQNSRRSREAQMRGTRAAPASSNADPEIGFTGHAGHADGGSSGCDGGGGCGGGGGD